MSTKRIKSIIQANGCTTTTFDCGQFEYSVTRPYDRPIDLDGLNRLADVLQNDIKNITCSNTNASNYDIIGEQTARARHVLSESENPVGISRWECREDDYGVIEMSLMEHEGNLVRAVMQAYLTGLNLPAFVESACLALNLEMQREVSHG